MLLADKLPAKTYLALSPFRNAKPFSSESPGIAGVLVVLAGKRRRSKPLKFTDPHAALDWCIQEHAGTGLYYNADPSCA